MLLTLMNNSCSRPGYSDGVPARPQRTTGVPDQRGRGGSQSRGTGTADWTPDELTDITSMPTYVCVYVHESVVKHMYNVCVYTCT